MPNPPIYLPPGNPGEPPKPGDGLPPGWEVAWSPIHGWILVSAGGKPLPLPTPPGHVDNTLPPGAQPKQNQE